MTTNSPTPPLERHLLAERERGTIWAVQRRFSDGRVDYMIDPSPNDHFRSVFAPNVISTDWRRVEGFR